MLCFNNIHSQHHDLQAQLEHIALNAKATVGISVITDKHTITVNNNIRYPLMSVFKLHIAVTAIHKIETENIDIDSIIVIERQKMRPDTYSPLRDRFPDKDIRISYADILRYTISQSDNNTCDWLIEFIGGIKKADEYIHSLGISGFALSETEHSMHTDIMNSYNNWSTPLSTALLMKKIFCGHLFSPKHSELLNRALINTQTGTDKLKAGIPSCAILAHKTGSSDTIERIKIADNDTGVVLLNDGRQIYITVFVMNSTGTDYDNAGIIAAVAQKVIEFEM